MSDDITGTEPASTDVAEATGPDVDQQNAPSQEGGNPHWESVRSTLDPLTYHRIEPFLKEADKNAETRISSVNAQLAAYKEFGSPDEIRNYAMIAQRIDSEPEVIYEALGQFLQEHGRMPQTQQEVQEAVDEVEEEAAESPVDPRLERIEQFLATQEQQRIEREADEALTTEIEQLRQAHPEFDQADIQEVLNRAVVKATTSKKEVRLAEVAEDYLTNVVNRIRSTPRAGDSAPRLIPTSGGTATGAGQKTPDQLSRSETQDLIASLISQGRRG